MRVAPLKIFTKNPTKNHDEKNDSTLYTLYTYQQLRNNISQVASIVNSEIDSSDIRTSTFIPWLDNDWKQLYYKHWYFAITVEEIEGELTAVVQDAHYEGDHHNDTLLGKPYDIEDLQYKNLY